MKKYIVFVALCAVASMQGMLKQSLRLAQTKKVVGLVQQRNFKNNLYVMHEGRYRDKKVSPEAWSLHQRAQLTIKSLGLNARVVAISRDCQDKKLRELEAVVAEMWDIIQKQEQVIADLRTTSICQKNKTYQAMPLEYLKKRIDELDSHTPAHCYEIRRRLHDILLEACPDDYKGLLNFQPNQYILRKSLEIIIDCKRSAYDAEIFALLLPFVEELNSSCGLSAGYLLHMAIANVRPEIVALLLERQDLDINVRAPTGGYLTQIEDVGDIEEPLFAAMKYGHGIIVKMLLSDPRINLSDAAYFRKSCRDPRLIAIFDEFGIKE